MLFPTTQWTILAEATLEGSPAGRAALEELCGRYRRPLVAFWEARKVDTETAQDLAQEVLAELALSRLWKKADRERGRFRTFLLTVAQRIEVDVWRSRMTQKRGGTSGPTQSLDELMEAVGFEPPDPAEPGVANFDRAWAAGLVERAYAALEEQYAADGKTELLLKLKSSIIPGPVRLSTGALADELKTSEGNVRTMVSRLRDQFRAELRKGVAQTVQAVEDVDDEMAYLHRVLRGG